MFDLLSVILESVPGAPGPPMPPAYSVVGPVTGAPSCPLDAPPTDPGAEPQPKDVPIFGAKGKDYLTVRALDHLGDTYKQDRSIVNAAKLLVTLPLLAPLVVLEDTFRNPVPGVHGYRRKSGCPHG
ncbi:MAG TPA: hypothetical protein VLR27_06925 [Acidimicrobiales bacterium]|nr:hypothetical protein [Acidimicrobiales bacterium]